MRARIGFIDVGDVAVNFPVEAGVEQTKGGFCGHPGPALKVLLDFLDPPPSATHQSTANRALSLDLHLPCVPF